MAVAVGVGDQLAHGQHKIAACVFADRRQALHREPREETVRQGTRERDAARFAVEDLGAQQYLRGPQTLAGVVRW